MGPQVHRECPALDPADKSLTAEAFYLLSSQEKVAVLLGKHIGCQTAEGHIDTHIKRFLRKTWTLRTPYNRHDNLALIEG